MIYGYARVSSPGQDHAGQVAELEAAGCERVFREKMSGKAGSRLPQRATVLAMLQPGDVLVFTRLNRFARSAREALNLFQAIDAKGAEFRSLHEAWADTTTPAGRLMVTIMVGLAEFDREMILERTGEGRAYARQRGVKFGRPPTLSPQQMKFIREARAETPPKSIGELQKVLNVSRSTIIRACRDDYRAAPPPAPRRIDLEDVIGRRGEVPTD